MNNKVIGVCGFAKNGKDSFYKLLSKRNPNKFERLAFADELKRDLFDLIRDQFGFDVMNPTPEQKEIIRGIMIGYGCAWRKVDILHWTKIIAKDIDRILKNNNEVGLFNDKLGPEIIPAVTDFRFFSEGEYFKNKYGNDFILVKVSREGAPIPPDEELKNQPELDKLVDFFVEWPSVGENNIDQLMPYVNDFCAKYQL